MPPPDSKAAHSSKEQNWIVADVETKEFERILTAPPRPKVEQFKKLESEIKTESPRSGWNKIAPPLLVLRQKRKKNS